MKTLTKTFAKRSLSVLLVLMMVFSLLTVGITSTSAAEVETAETGASTITLFFRNDYSWSDIHLYYSGSSQSSVTWRGNAMTLVSGTTNVYSSVIPDDATLIVFSGVDTSNNTKQTVDITETTINVDGSGYYCNGWSGDKTTVAYYKYRDPVSSGDSGDTGTTTVPDYATVTVISNNNTYTASNIHVYAFNTDKTELTSPWHGEAVDSNSSVTFETNNEEYWVVINDGGSNQTADLGPFTAGNVTITIESDGSVTSEESESTVASFWVDTNANIPYAEDAVDILKPYIKDNVAYLYLPAGTDTDNLMFYSDGEGVKVNGTTIASTGTAVSVTPDGTTAHTLEGAAVSTLKVYQSTASAMYTITGEALPTTTGYGTPDASGDYHKDDYSSSNKETENADGTITNTQYYAMANPDGTLIADKKGETVPVLDKVKGRGNSSWNASAKLFGKYAFNITLGTKSDLVGDDGTQSKKYCLVSYNADEARMRNMLTYSLSQDIGLNYVADYKPVDLYNNNQYIGSYLLTDKVEIGDPLVEIVNLDEINEEWSDNNTALYDEDENMVRSCGGPSGVTLNTTDTPGFFKFIQNLEEPPASEYAESGFLLEFEINDRFDDEISGFISKRGQQIVCKYPEYATYKEMLFIMGKWYDAEDAMYDSSADYETLSQYIDVESFAKMYLIQELTKNVDAGATSYYVYYHNSKFYAGCSWDFDWALGQYYNSRSLVNESSSNYTAESKQLSVASGWWARIKQIYKSLNETTGVYNAQAALCQNDAFWKVVQAEWNENFYNTVSKYVVNSANADSPSDLASAKIHDFYTDVHASTEMDESRWGFIASDLLVSWGSKDTDDDHDGATVWLNDFIYDRITWMDTNGLNSEDYTIQPPVVSLATDMPEGGFDVGTEVVLNIDDVTDGSYTYTIYKNGVELGTTTDKTYPVTAETGDNVYTVKAVSDVSDKASELSNEVTVTGSGYPLTPTISASAESVLTGTDVTLTVGIEEAYTDVTYTVYYGDQSATLDAGVNTFTFTQTTAGFVDCYVVATAVVDGETVTETSDTVTVTFNEFTVDVTATNNGSIMQSQSVTITATPSITENVTYTFYKDDEVIAGYENVTTNIYTEKMDDSGSFTYKVVAKYSDRTAEATVTVNVTAFDGTFNVKVLFKSSTVYAYQPNMTINDKTVDLVEETAIEVNKVGNGISNYRWYSYTFAEELTYGTEITVNVCGNRDYFYNASYTFEVGNTDFAYWPEDGTISYYLALDNLNDRSIKTLSNISGMDVYERAWTESAVHMIYNADVDGVLIAPTGFSFRFADYGDANCDGKINIKDATYVQKSLANIVEADTLSTTVSDFNHDGKVTIKDATAIQKRIAGL